MDCLSACGSRPQWHSEWQTTWPPNWRDLSNYRFTWIHLNTLCTVALFLYLYLYFNIKFIILNRMADTGRTQLRMSWDCHYKELCTINVACLTHFSLVFQIGRNTANGSPSMLRVLQMKWLLCETPNMDACVLVVASRRTTAILGVVLTSCRSWMNAAPVVVIVLPAWSHFTTRDLVQKISNHIYKPDTTA